MRRANIESLSNGILRGWYWNDADPADKTVNISIDGQFVGSSYASIRREDLREASIGDGCHAFTFAIPVQWRDGAVHRFELSATSTDDQPAVAASEFQSNIIACYIDGKVEHVAGRTAEGWACDHLDRGRRLQINIYADGEHAGSVNASEYRPDLEEAGIGDGSYGFRIQLPLETVNRARAVAFEVRAQNGACSQTIAKFSIPPEFSPEELIKECNGEVSDFSAVWHKYPPAQMRVLEKKLRKLSNEGLYLQAKVGAVAAKAVIKFQDNLITWECEKPVGWVRLLRLTPPVRTLASCNWLIEIAFVALQPGLLTLNLVTCNEVGNFSTVCRLQKHTYSGGPQSFSATLRSKALRAYDLDISERPTFLSLESVGSVSINALTLAMRPQPLVIDPAPFRNSEMEFCVQLTTLNDTMPQSCKRNPFHWLVDMAEVAVKAECFDTASLLLTKFEVIDNKDEALIARYLLVYIEVAFATGAVDDLRKKLLSHMKFVMAEDRLFSALSLCFPAKAELADFFSFLPSGAANRSFISRSGLTSASLKATLQTVDKHNDGQTNFLLASLYRNISSSLWIDYFNNFMETANISKLAYANCNTTNVLASISFDRPNYQVSTGGLVSVIISAFNASLTIHYAIRSILQQTYQNIELLICDDGSKDNTLSIIKEFGDHPAVRLYQSSGNQGPYNIRNALIKRAKGQYITFQDADDLSHPQRIEKQVKALNESGRRATLCKWLRIRPNGEVVFFRDQRCIRLCVVSLLAEKSLLEELGPYRSVLCGADSELFERLRLGDGRAAFEMLDLPLILGLWSAQSLTQQNGLEATEDGFRSRARRAYAEIAGRHRLLGADLVPSADVDDVNRREGIHRSSQPIFEVK